VLISIMVCEDNHLPSPARYVGHMLELRLTVAQNSEIRSLVPA
jgi:hypothetical protein